MGAERREIRKSDFRRLGEFLWELPREFDRRMRVPVHVYADDELLEDALRDASLRQAVNVASLPGLVGRVAVMPDVHEGYGMPVGGVMASRVPDGIVSPGAIGYDINCLAGDAEVLHAFGYRVPIAAERGRWRGERLVCLDLAERRPAETPALLWFARPPEAPVLALRTETGAEIKATADHPFLTPQGMKPLGDLRPGDLVARYHFEGVPYERPPADVIVHEADVEAVLARHRPGRRGGACAQVLAFLRRRGLIPLRLDSPALPRLTRLLGYVFGDGTVSFHRRTGKGAVSCCGKAEDLEAIRSDLLALGFSPGPVRRRRRQREKTTYGRCSFEQGRTWLHVSSSSLAALLAALGAPVGSKAAQDFTAPAWLEGGPRWLKRLFLAGLFGAEPTAPCAVPGHGRTLSAPTLSLSKRADRVASGEAFLRQLARWLAELGVEVQNLSLRTEPPDADGRRSVRLRLTISAAPENLVRLWSTVGCEYNRERQARAAVAAAYLRLKLRHLRAREAAARPVLLLAAGGASLAESERALAGLPVDGRFLERTVHLDREGPPRVGAVFPSFARFAEAATAGLEGTGFVWERVEEITPVAGAETVYDFTVAHRDHNFVANGFVVSNCGVRLLASDVTREQVEPVLNRLADAIDRNCPSGVGSEGHFPLSERELEEVMEEGARWALRRGLGEPEDLERTEEGGCLPGALGLGGGLPRSGGLPAHRPGGG